MVKIKICGITNLKDAKAAVDAGADTIGFVFTKSPRQIKPYDASKIIKQLPVFVNFAGVFVNEKKENVEKIIRTCGIDTLQFHGDEMPSYCEYFRKARKVIKAFRIKDRDSLMVLSKYDVDGYMLDTFVDGVKGGTGKVFDWQLAKQAKKLAYPIILSGGLNPKNVKSAIKIVRPYAVDVSSGVELKPGKKDLKLIKEFIKAVKNE